MEERKKEGFVDIVASLHGGQISSLPGLNLSSGILYTNP